MTKVALTLTERGFVTIYASYNYALEQLKIRVVDSVTSMRREGEKSSLHIMFRQVAGLDPVDEESNDSRPKQDISIGLKICR